MLVGMLPCLINRLRPEIAIVVRDLSKSIARTTMAAYKELMKITKLLLDTVPFS
jgi:hypothetical protein